jgi:hypothetical protein
MMSGLKLGMMVVNITKTPAILIPLSNPLVVSCSGVPPRLSPHISMRKQAISQSTQGVTNNKLGAYCRALCDSRWFAKVITSL